MEAAKAFIRTAWANRVDSQHPAPKHPKSALQEWAAAHRRKPPAYALTGKSGPHHNPRFNVTVSIKGVGEATAEGSSKQETDTAETGRESCREREGLDGEITGVAVS